LAFISGSTKRFNQHDNLLLASITEADREQMAKLFPLTKGLLVGSILRIEHQHFILKSGRKIKYVVQSA
jgi:hypothetical protein